MDFYADVIYKSFPLNIAWSSNNKHYSTMAVQVIWGYLWIFCETFLP